MIGRRGASLDELQALDALGREALLEEARVIAAALESSALERVASEYWLAFETRGPNRELIDVSFDPILPDGANVCPPCG